MPVDLTKVIPKMKTRKAQFDNVDAIKLRIFDRYIENICAYLTNVKMLNPITGKEVPPDKNLMRSIEEYADISEQSADAFRRSVMAFAGTLAVRGIKFTWNSISELGEAIEKKIEAETRNSSSWVVYVPKKGNGK